MLFCKMYFILSSLSIYRSGMHFWLNIVVYCVCQHWEYTVASFFPVVKLVLITQFNTVWTMIHVHWFMVNVNRSLEIFLNSQEMRKTFRVMPVFSLLYMCKCVCVYVKCSLLKAAASMLACFNDSLANIKSGVC